MESDAESSAPSLPADGASNQPYILDPLKHLRLAKFIAKKYRSVQHRVDEADILGAAYEGLLRGCRTFDPSRGVTASTYLSKVMRHEILHLFGGLAAKAKTLSLDAEIQVNGEPTTLLDTLASSSLDESDFDPRIREVTAEWIASLPDRHRLVIQLRYIEQKTLQEVAKVFGVTREAISQIEKRTIEDLKRRIGNVE